MIGDLFQECERMNTLMNEMKRSMKELVLGLKGELTITSDMEDLSNSLFFDQVFKITNINLNPYSLQSSSTHNAAIFNTRFLQPGPSLHMPP